MSVYSLLKRLILLILVIASVATLFSLVACNNNGEQTDNTQGGVDLPTIDYRIGIIADPQVTPSASVDNPFKNTAYIQDMSRRESMDMTYLSEAVYLSAVDKYIEEKVDAVFIIGDITDNRDARAVSIIQNGCQKLKDAGIASYVTLGINDINATPYTYYNLRTRTYATAWGSLSFFPEFTKYMSAEPVAIHEETFSYAADLPGSEYRLISFNSARSFSGTNIHNISVTTPATNSVEDEQIQWLESQLQSAESHGKTVVMTTYFPLTADINYQCGTLERDSFLTMDKAKTILPMLTKYHVNVVYNGHIHMEGEPSYEDNYGSVKLVSTTSLATYPLPIKISNHTDEGFVSEIKHLEKMNGNYLPSYIESETANRLTTDAVGFAKDYLKNAFVSKWRYLTKIGNPNNSVAVTILTKLSINNGSEASQSAIEKLENWLTGVNKLNLYGESDSVEAICKKYNVDVPKISGMTTVLDFMEEMSCAVFCGDLDIKPGSDNAVMLKCAMFAGFYMLADTQILGELNKINSGIKDCDLMPLIGGMFQTGKIDLASNDFIVSLLSIFVPLFESKHISFSVEGKTTKSILDTLNVLLPIALTAFGDAYNPSKRTLWLVPYDELFDLEHGTINASALIDSLGASLICKNVLSRR